MTRSLEAAIAAFSPALPVAVAYSGGADSSALLRVCARRWPAKVAAIHVNHGLQSAAASFQAHCQATCEDIGVPLFIETVDAHAAPGQSPEDAARRARYGALARFAKSERGAPWSATVLLAQHADDQAETLLLALSRGAGLAGLSAMPAQWQRDGVCYARPLLQVSASDIRDWLRAQGHAWIEDPTNTDTDFLRNRIRAELMPALRQVFPQYASTFARSAAHAAQAQALLVDLAQADLRSVYAPGQSRPLIKALQALPYERQANALRYWLRSVHQTQATSAQLDALQAQVAACTTAGHNLHIRVGHGFVRRSNDSLDWYN